MLEYDDNFNLLPKQRPSPTAIKTITCKLAEAGEISDIDSPDSVDWSKSPATLSPNLPPNRNTDTPPATPLLPWSIVESPSPNLYNAASDLATATRVSQPFKTQPKSRLLTMPGELRNTIYGYVFHDNATLHINAHRVAAPAIGRVCHQIEQECAGIFAQVAPLHAESVKLHLDNLDTRHLPRLVEALPTRHRIETQSEQTPYTAVMHLTNDAPNLDRHIVRLATPMVFPGITGLKRSEGLFLRFEVRFNPQQFDTAKFQLRMKWAASAWTDDTLMMDELLRVLFAVLPGVVPEQKGSKRREKGRDDDVGSRKRVLLGKQTVIEPAMLSQRGPRRSVRGRKPVVKPFIEPVARKVRGI